MTGLPYGCREIKYGPVVVTVTGSGLKIHRPEVSGPGIYIDMREIKPLSDQLLEFLTQLLGDYQTSVESKKEADDLLNKTHELFRTANEVKK